MLSIIEKIPKIHAIAVVNCEGNPLKIAKVNIKEIKRKE